MNSRQFESSKRNRLTAVGDNHVLRPFCASDHSAVASLLKDLPSTYPGGDLWLHRRLQDVKSFKAFCTVVLVRGVLAGLTIEVEKGERRRKLSTVFVDPAFRGAGLGSLLLRNCSRTWEKCELDEVFVTVRSTKLHDTGVFLMLNGFQAIAIEKDRYGDGNDEAILRWAPATSWAANQFSASHDCSSHNPLLISSVLQG
jgi:ribosomal protein S18 acetylase RimI-like enzyme